MIYDLKLFSINNHFEILKAGAKSFNKIFLSGKIQNTLLYDFILPQNIWNTNIILIVWKNHKSRDLESHNIRDLSTLFKKKCITFNS